MATRSFYAAYRAKHGTMIGGVTQSQTSRFQVRSDAQRRLDDVIELNGGNVEGEVLESELPPQIFRHCHPTISQSIAGKCCRCGKVLDAADAEAAEPVFD